MDANIVRCAWPPPPPPRPRCARASPVCTNGVPKKCKMVEGNHKRNLVRARFARSQGSRAEAWYLAVGPCILWPTALKDERGRDGSLVPSRGLFAGLCRRGVVATNPSPKLNRCSTRSRWPCPANRETCTLREHTSTAPAIGRLRPLLASFVPTGGAAPPAPGGVHVLSRSRGAYIKGVFFWFLCRRGEGALA